MTRGLLGLLLVTLVAPIGQRPTFKSTTEVVSVEASVVSKNGLPIRDLRSDDFEVSISGTKRRIVSFQYVDYSEPLPRTAMPSSGGSSKLDVAPRPRRMFILAVDEHSLHISNALAGVEAAGRFLDRLQPDDLVGVYAYPTGAAKEDLTTDHAKVRRALRQVTGLFIDPPNRYNLSPSEIIDVASDSEETQRSVWRRECQAGGCSAGDIRREATSLAAFLEMRVTQSLGGLRGLISSLREIPGRKVLVLVSGGLVSTDRSVGRANFSGEISQLGREAAFADVSVFALHLDWSFLEALGSRGGLRLSYFRDSNLAASGLDQVAGAAGGTVIRVHGTSPNAAFDRVLLETSGYYLLGVDRKAEDREGRIQPIKVSVRRSGSMVRSRKQIVLPSR